MNLTSILILPFALPLLVASTDNHQNPDSLYAAHKTDTVILLHGIMNRPFHMTRIKWALENEGFRVINWGYPSTKKTVEEHASDLHKIVQSLDHDQRIHFVGFSLGSIVIRYYLTHYEVDNAGRFVMIAPPNQGSEIADLLYPYGWFGFLYGTKSMTQLRASNQVFFEAMGTPPVPFGIIAGGRGDAKGRSRIIPGDDDGSVSVESTKLEGAQDYILLNRQHTALVFSRITAQNVLSFLRTGRFEHRP